MAPPPLPSGHGAAPGLLDVLLPARLCLAPAAPLREGLQRLREEPDSCVVVLAHGRPLGVLTLRDAVGLLLDGTTDLDLPLQAVMRQPALCIAHDASPAEAAARMQAAQVRRLVVVDEAGCVVGLVSDASLRRERERRETLAEHARQRAVLDAIPDLVWLKDPDGFYVSCNPRFERLFGASEAQLRGRRDHDFVPLELAEFFRAHDRLAMARNGPSVNEELLTFADDGHQELTQTVKTPVRDAEGRLLGVLGIGRDITALRRSQERERRRAALLEGLLRGETLQALLARLAADHERTYPDSRCSLMLLDDDGLHARLACAPSLPAAYGAAVDGLRIGAGAGTCGTAMALAQRVLTRDIATDPAWAAWRDAALAAGLRACWSEPIIGSQGRVLGSFAVYRREPGEPGAEELEHMGLSVQLAAVAIERTRTLQQLQDGERRTRDILRTIPDLVWMKDTQGLYVDANPRFEALVGRPLADIVGRTSQALLPATACQALEAADAQVLATQAAVTLELWLQGPDGASAQLYEVIKAPVFDGEQRLAGVLGVARDITRLKQGERAIAEQESLVRTMFSQTTDSITLVEPETARMVTFNDAACAGLGYGREAFARMGPHDFQAEHTPAQIRANIERALAGEAPSFETRHRRADGSIQDAVVRLRRVDYGGRALVSAVWRDITEVKQRETRLARLNRSYAVLSGVNEAIVRLRDSHRLCAEVCRIAVAAGGFRLAWIGQLDGAGQFVTPVAAAGEAAHYASGLRIDVHHSDGPTARAICTGQPAVIADISQDASVRPWRDRALAGGLRSCAAFPIHVSARLFGCLLVYSDQPGHFDADQRSLFLRLVQDVGFALEFLAAEEAQRQDRHFRDQLIESVAGLFYVMDHEGRLLEWNHRLEEVTGRTAGELRQMPALDLFEEEERSLIAERIAEVFRHGQSRAEASLVARDGTRWPYLFESRRVDREPHPVLVGTGIDIAERVHSERELARYRQHLEELVAMRTAELESLNSRLSREDQRLRAMLALSAQANQLSEQALFRLGLRQVQALSASPLARLVLAAGDGQDAPLAIDLDGAAPEAAPAWCLAGQALARQGAVVSSPEHPTPEAPCAIAVPVLEDRQLRFVLCVAGRDEPYGADDERELALIGADLWSIVQRRRIELALEQAKLAADAASQAKSAFLANMSHEIRTPMNAVLGFAHLLRQDPLTPRQVDHLGKITDASQHLLQVINDILDFSKIEARKVAIDESDFELAASLRRVTDLLHERVRGKPVALTLEIAPGCPAHVRADRLRLEQVLLNLVGNAVKFTHHGEVRLSAQPVVPPAPGPVRPGAPVCLRLAVSDTGIGIAQDQLPRLFEAFAQADVSTTRRYGGTGLGLAISQRLVTLMGGHIGVDSRLGEGSTFWFELPVTVAAAPAHAMPAAPPATQAEEARRLRGARVLLVEDNPANQEVAQDLLRSMGAQVSTAGDGAQAVALVREHPRGYDLVLMDVQMPVMDGLQATRAIRALAGSEHLPIIAMTASAFSEDRSQCERAGMNDFLVKPVDPATLQHCLATWLPARPPAHEPAPAPAPGMAPGAGADLDWLTGLAGPLGLDLRDALARVRGDQRLYLRTLGLFARHHRDDATRLAQALQAGPPATLRALAHALAGAAATVGLTGLRRHARALEQAAADAQASVAALAPLVHALQAELVRVLALLQPLQAPAPAPPPGTAQPGQRQAARECLHALRALLTLHDTAVIDACARARPVLAPVLGEALHALDERILSFDFEAALAQVEQQLQDLDADMA